MQKTELNDIRKRKDRIRKEYLAKRNAMPKELVKRLSDEISDFVLGWDVYQKAQAVFFYYPLGNEVSLLPVIRDALKNGKQAAFPKTFGDEMEFYEITDLRDLKEGRFHVMEPAVNTKQPFYAQPDLCFVPGAVFDVSGGRFGYGKGYYDRFLKECKAYKIGICFPFQFREDVIPTDFMDVPMDEVIK